MNDATPCEVANANAWRGSSAPRICGACAMFHTPTVPSAANQATQTGPKNRPTTPVPWRWIANSATSTPAAIGTT